MMMSEVNDMDNMLFDGNAVLNADDFSIVVNDLGVCLRRNENSGFVVIPWERILKMLPSSEGYWLKRAKDLDKVISNLRDAVGYEKELNRKLRGEIRALHRKLGE